ncbi:MAG: response regulator [Deltaproteobacteria bacterium]|nr:response regulator [Deltaproteobacteria bacterium]
MRSLIINSDPDDRNLLKGILKEFGGVQMVTGGKIAVGLVKKALKTSSYFDLITLNPDLPDRDGIDTLMDIRSFEEEAEFKNTKRALIIMTATQWSKDRAVTAFSAGCDEYMLKPLDKEKVARFILEQLGVKEEEAQRPQEEEQTDPFNTIIHRFNSGRIDLPLTPQTSIEFNEVLKKDLGFTAIANVLKKDMSITGKLISISNSAYYGAATKIGSVEQALNRLGLVVTKQYVDAFCSRPLFNGGGSAYCELLDELWQHSLHCAVISEVTAKVLKLTLQSDAFINGLLHDIGKVVLLQSAGELERKGELIKKIGAEELMQFVNQYHNGVGSKVLKKWRFPYHTIHIALHHDDPDSPAGTSKDLLVANFANTMAKIMTGNGKIEQEGASMEEMTSARLLGITRDSLAEIEGRIEESLALYGGMIDGLS